MRGVACSWAGILPVTFTCVGPGLCSDSRVGSENKQELIPEGQVSENQAVNVLWGSTSLSLGACGFSCDITQDSSSHSTLHPPCPSSCDLGVPVVGGCRAWGVPGRTRCDSGHWGPSGESCCLRFLQTSPWLQRWSDGGKAEIPLLPDFVRIIRSYRSLWSTEPILGSVPYGRRLGHSSGSHRGGGLLVGRQEIRDHDCNTSLYNF